jgi:hypothetical protein
MYSILLFKQAQEHLKGNIYCAPRDLEMLDLPSPRRVTSSPRLPGNHKIEVKVQRDDLSAFLRTRRNGMTVIPRVPRNTAKPGKSDEVARPRVRGSGASDRKKLARATIWE